MTVKQDLKLIASLPGTVGEGSAAYAYKPPKLGKEQAPDTFKPH
jgi:hypothetical protein